MLNIGIPDRRDREGVDPLVVSGFVELAAGALTGWLYTLVKTDPKRRERLASNRARVSVNGTST